MKRILAIFIILLLPTIVIAHSGHDEVRSSWEADAGVLPGEVFYFIDRSGEWVDINLLTLSTKEKQKKYLASSQERLLELAVLADLAETLEVIDDKAIAKAASLYSRRLETARYMAEKIIFLDGAEIALAEDFEKKTFYQEVLLAGLFEELDPGAEGFVYEALISARNNNRLTFEYMVNNYQFTDEDIAKHKAILERHIDFVAALSEQFDHSGKNTELDANLVEARKFQEAGLNVQAYGFIEKAKNILY